MDLIVIEVLTIRIAFCGKWKSQFCFMPEYEQTDVNETITKKKKKKILPQIEIRWDEINYHSVVGILE